jgi:hypothetical protein
MFGSSLPSALGWFASHQSLLGCSSRHCHGINFTHNLLLSVVGNNLNAADSHDRYRIGCESSFADDGCSLSGAGISAAGRAITAYGRFDRSLSRLVRPKPLSVVLCLDVLPPGGSDRPTVGYYRGWCSILTFVVALFGKRLKRYAGLASVVITFFLWGLAGLGDILSGHWANVVLGRYRNLTAGRCVTSPYCSLASGQSVLQPDIAVESHSSTFRSGPHLGISLVAQPPSRP